MHRDNVSAVRRPGTGTQHVTRDEKQFFKKGEKRYQAAVVECMRDVFVQRGGRDVTFDSRYFSLEGDELRVISLVMGGRSSDGDLSP